MHLNPLRINGLRMNSYYKFKTILLFISGLSLLPLNDAIIKLLSSELSLGQIILVRSVFSIIFFSIIFKNFTSLFKIEGKIILLFTLRATLIVLAMMFFFMSLASLSIAIATAIFFISPALITILSVIILGERIGIHRIISIVIGFLGILTIVQPFKSSFQIESMIALISAFFYALYQIFTRKLQNVGKINDMILIQQLIYFVFGLLLCTFNYLHNYEEIYNKSLSFLFRPSISLDYKHLLLLLMASLIFNFFTFSSTYAYRKTEASIIAPFEYVALPFSIFWGFLIWKDIPSQNVWIGIIFIVISGLYIFHREKKNQISKTTL